MREVARNTARLQVAMACLLLLFASAVTAASPEAFIRELGPSMEFYQGSWDKQEPPPQGQGDWVPIETETFATIHIDVPIWLRTNLKDLDTSRQHWLILHPYAQQVKVYVDGNPTTPDALHFFATVDERPVQHHFLVYPIALSATNCAPRCIPFKAS